MLDVFPIPEGARYDYAQAWTSAHHGTDVFASRGQPVVAVARGTARAAVDPKGGNVVYLTADDGWRYYYAHLDAWAPGLEPGQPAVPVESGAFLGQVGASGNAAGKAPHLHFQASPPGGGAVDPYPLLVAVDPHVADEPLPVQTDVPPPPADVVAPSVAPSSTAATAAAGAGSGLLMLALLWAFGGKRRR